MKYSNSNSAIPTSYFSDKVLVICPKCGEQCFIVTKVKISIQTKPIDFVSTVKCETCKYSSIINKKPSGTTIGIYQGFRIKNCPNCQQVISVITEPTVSFYQDIEVSCPSCHQVNTVTLHWNRYRDNSAVDPFLGYELLLKTNLKDDIIWFYNFNHLDFVRDYINAKLREDNFRQKYSLISNLPKFMLLAKNRSLINNKISKLEEQFRR